jgi:hypothetical protein
MGYSNSIEAVNKVEGFLKTLLSSIDDVVAWRARDSKRLQYFIHNGLNAAEFLEHKDFKDLKNTWKIKARDGAVIAERKQPISVPLLFSDVTDFYSVMTHIAQYKEQDLQFTDVWFNDEEKEKLSKYCLANHISYTLEGKNLNVTRTGDT